MMKRMSLGVAVLAVILLSMTIVVSAQDDFGFTPLGAGFAGVPYVLEGDVVIETLDFSESIRDYAEADAPVLLGWNYHGFEGGRWKDVLYDDGLLAALQDFNSSISGCAVFDFADPTRPAMLADIGSTDFTSGWLQDGVLILSLPVAYLIYDLDDPANPTFAAAGPLGESNSARWFSAVEGTLYCIDRAADLRVLDIADPLHPTNLGTVSLTGERIDAVIATGIHLQVLVATGVEGGGLDLVTLDTSSPLAPIETGRQTLTTGPMSQGVALAQSGQLLLAATSDGQVKAFGLEDPSAPLPGWSLQRFTTHLAMSEHWIFHTNGEQVDIYPLTDHLTPPGDPIERKVLPRLSGLGGEGPIQVVQNYERSRLLAQVDVTDPLQPKLGAWFDTGMDGEFAVSGGLGIKFDFGRLQLFDVVNPDGISALGFVADDVCNFWGPVAFDSRVVAIKGHHNYDFGALIFDISDPQVPHLKSVLECPWPIEIVDDILLGRDDGRVLFYDLADPSAPELLSFIGFDAVHGCGLGHGFACVLLPYDAVQDQVQLFDLTDPEAPLLSAVILVDDVASSLFVHDDLLIVRGYGQSQDLVYDVTDLEHPELTGILSRPPGSSGRTFAFNGDVVTQTDYLATYRYVGQGTVHAPDATPIAACSLDPAYPNPFNPSTTIAFSVDRRRELTVTIHDLRGHKIADLATGLFTPGRHDVTWQGQDAAGRSVASGVYLVRLHGPGVEAAQTVTLVK